MKKLTLSLVLFVLFFGFNLAHADVIINEIMYSPTSKQWIEIYNDSGAAIDLTQYKILDAGAAVNGHGISLCSGLLSPQSYAIIAKVPEDFSSASFTVCKSALGIKSTTDDTVILKIDSNEIDSVSVTGGSATDGNSLQLLSGSWITSTPTPGAQNQESSASGNDESDDSSDENTDASSGENTSASLSTTSNSSSGSSSKKSTEPKTKELKTQVKITAPKVAFVNLPFDLSSEASNSAGEKFNTGKYFWNFGDGNSKETRDAKNFSYTYSYEGEYVVSLEYYSKSSSQVRDAVAEVTIKVVTMDVSISKVGNQNDFFIELSNNTNYEVDISRWVLSSLNKIFVFPKNSSLLSKKKIILSPQITHFTFEDAKNLKLHTASNELVFEYGDLTSSSSSPSRRSDPPAPNFPTSRISDEEQVSSKDLSAAAISSDAFFEEEKEKNKDTNTYLPMLGGAVLVFGSAGAAYFIRKKKIVASPGDDFNILNE